MKFDLSALPEEAIVERVQVGDVLPAKGGRGTTALWLVVAVNGNTAHMLGLNRDGEIVSTTSYGMHALTDRAVVGHCNELAEFVATIQCGARRDV